VEIWFYCVFAAVLRWAPARRRTEALAAVAGLLVAAGCLYRGDWALPRFVGLPMFLEFAAGAALYRHRWALGHGGGAVLAPAGAVLACFAAMKSHQLGYVGSTFGKTELGLLRATLWGPPAVMLVAGAVALDLRGIRWPAPLVKVGDWSYSAYLVQPFAILALGGIEWPCWQAGSAALLALVLAMSWLSHCWIERPATRWLRELLRGGAGDGDRRAGGPLPGADASAVRAG
jgi:exopolysaccharide production protein ExoZ